MKKIASVILMCAMLIVCADGMAAESRDASSWIDSAGVRMAAQLYNFPQEKVHVTTDQGCYIAGDTVWMRMFTVDAATNVPVRLSYYCYVDVTDPLGREMCRIKLRRDTSGVLSGYIPTDVDWPEGVYNMRAYTAFMQNAGEEYFFSKNLPLVSPYRTQASLKADFGTAGNGETTLSVELLGNNGNRLECNDIAVTTAKRSYARGLRCRSADFRLDSADLAGHAVLVKADNYAKFLAVPADTARRSVRFFAEGGYLVPSAVCTVGVRVTDGVGRPVEATGVVTDGSGNEIARFGTIHDGMGSFTFVPREGESYSATVGGETYALPAVTAEAAVVQLKTGQKDYVLATAVGNVPEGAVLLVHNCGRGVYIDRIKADTPLKFPRSELGDGVVSFMLTDGEGNALSERLAFNMPESKRLAGAESRVSANGRELTIALPDSVDRADVAVAVLDGQLAEADTLSAIGPQLLLQSELRGRIDDPAWYFRPETPHRLAAAGLDALMLTQGWRRYDVPSVVRGTIAEPQIPVEQGPSIVGTVRSLWRNKPVANVNIYALVPESEDAGLAVTGEKGEFSIEGLDWPENAAIIVQAVNKNGNFERNVQLDTIALASVGQPAVQPADEIRTDAEAGMPVTTADYSYRIEHADGMMQVHLGEVVIARAKPRVASDFCEVIARSSLDVEKMKSEDGVTSYEELLLKIPGVTIKNGKIYSRNEPVSFLINGSHLWQGVAAGGNSIYRGSTSRGNGAFLSTPDVMLTGFKTQDGIGGQKGSTVNMLGDGDNTLTDFQMAYPLQSVKRIDFIPTSMTHAFQMGGGPLLNVVLKDVKDGPKERNWEINQFYLLGYQRAAEYFTPDYSSADYDPVTEAARPLLYWLPSITLSPDKPLRLALPQGVKPIVVVEGVAADGVIISGK